MNKLLAGGLGAAAAVVLSLPAPAQDAEGPMLSKGEWYVSPMVSVMAPDEDRLGDVGYGAQLGIGRMITPRLAIELNANGTTIDGYNEVGQFGAGLDLLALGNLSGKIAPYAVFGAGYTANQYREGNPSLPFEDNDDLTLSIGGGAMFRVGTSPALFRAEVRLRNELADNNLTDFVASAGMVFPFGKKAAPMPMDSDGDGVPDADDRCPNTPPGAIVDATGCELDSDGDGVSDRLDQCPGTPAGTRVDAVGCPFDSDGDGVSDDEDRCPDTPRGTLVGPDGCPLDSDRDGVPDARDECPGTRAGVRVDFRGCEIVDVIELPGVNFQTNSNILTPDSVGTLDGAVSTLRRYPELRVECAGHTDSRGAADYNQGLSQRRAEAVCDYLTSQGIASNRLSERGYGESEPIADNETAAGRAANRRVELRVFE